ncbi:MAG TPA: flagellar motor protein MotB [Pirellulales bacterium]|nr:flagellar motor protein MotB [Pirellulales bacterium]
MAIEEDPPAGVPDWVVTFGDMMSLLLTFFILLFSMSEIRSNEKIKELMGSMQRTFGRHPAPVSPLPVGVVRSSARQAPAAPQGKEKKRTRARSGLDNSKVAVGEDPLARSVRQGTYTIVGRAILFPESSATLSDDARIQLDEAALLLAGKPNKIAVRGHTSRKPLPDGSRFHSDWELAFARCNRAAEYLVSKGIERERLELDVVGASEPVYRGANHGLLQENSRVEVFLLDRFVEQFGRRQAEPQQDEAKKAD